MLNEILRVLFQEIWMGLWSRLGLSKSSQHFVRWLLVPLLIWVVIAHLLFWGESNEGLLGIWSTTVRGFPTGTIALILMGNISLTAIVALILLWRNAPGIFTLLVCIAFIFMCSTFSSGFLFEVIENRNTGGTWVLALFSVGAYAFLVVTGAKDELVPLDSILARLIYGGRLQHLRELYVLGKKWNWNIKGPENPNKQVTVMGYWKGRELYLTSGSIFKYPELYDFLRVELSSPKSLWNFALAIKTPGLTKAQHELAVKGLYDYSWGRKASFFLWPPSGHPIEQTELTPITTILASGKRFLRKRTMMYAFDSEVFYERRGNNFFAKATTIEDLLSWLDEFAKVMEERGFAEEADRRREM